MKFDRVFKTLSLLLLAAMFLMCLTGCATATTAEAGAEAGTGSSVSMIAILVVMVAVFYFFMIRPENKKKQKLEEMRSALSVGDDITTIGGIVGKVVAVKDDFIVFETSEDRVRIQVAKWAISTTGKAKTESQANVPDKD